MIVPGTINWIKFARLVGLWAAFYLFIKFGIYWIDDGGFAFKQYVITKPIIIQSLVILMIAKTINSLCRIFIWDFIVYKILKGLVPFLLVQCISFGVYTVSILIIIGMIFGKSIVGFLATLGGIGVIIGLGVQRLVLDAFSGILINLDSSFTLGDFIQINVKNSLVMGRVTNISWRLTTITTPEGSEVCIPNSVVSGTAMMNLSKPTVISEFEQMYCFHPSQNDGFISDILTNAVLYLKEMGYLENTHPPKVRLSRVTCEQGAVYKIKYYLDPTKNGPGKVKHFLNTAVLRHANATGLHFYDSNKMNISIDQNLTDGGKIEKQKIHRLELISAVPVFDELSNQELMFLLSNMARHIFKPGCAIVSQGEEGHSMYIIEKGLAKVHVKQEDAPDAVVSILNPGDYFGEMSLLTGEKTTATVVSETEVVTYEITKDIISSLVHENPQLYENFARVIANKIISTQQYFKKSQQHEEKNTLVDEFLHKIRDFFHRSHTKDTIT